MSPALREAIRGAGRFVRDMAGVTLARRPQVRIPNRTHAIQQTPDHVLAEEGDEVSGDSAFQHQSGAVLQTAAFAGLTHGLHVRFGGGGAGQINVPFLPLSGLTDEFGETIAVHQRKKLAEKTGGGYIYGRPPCSECDWFFIHRIPAVQGGFFNFLFWTLVFFDVDGVREVSANKHYQGHLQPNSSRNLSSCHEPIPHVIRCPECPANVPMLVRSRD